jgi:uncharacterized protein YjbI with pentapeptide repeats
LTLPTVKSGSVGRALAWSAGRNLTHANLKGANLADATFLSAKLIRADLTNT